MSEYVRDLDRYLELNASFPLDEERRLRGEAGQAIAAHILGLMAANEQRKRALSAKAVTDRTATVEALIANLVVAALSRSNPDRYVAVSFNRSVYKEMGLSHDAMVLARSTLVERGLIEYNPGVFAPHFIDFMEFRRLARIRVTPALRHLFNDFNVGLGTVTRLQEKLIKLKHGEWDAGPEPSPVYASRAVLTRINACLESSELALPDDAWARIEQRRKEKAKGKNVHIPGADDLTAKALYRVFTGNWNRGGRLYGGWWQSVDSEERRHLTIDGEPTVEIDFGHAHPALLYRAMGKQLDRDPYGLPPYSRDLCKETFQRLINRAARTGGADIKRPKKFKPPADIPYEVFLADYKQHLFAVADCFGKGIGLLLQKEDSELTLAILGELNKQGTVALSIHDSFIVKQSHKATLWNTMSSIYLNRYGVNPSLKEMGVIIEETPERR